MKESQTSVIELPGKDPKNVELLLRKLYPPCLEQITQENASIFASFAQEYEIAELKIQVENFLLNHHQEMWAALIADEFSFLDVLDLCIKRMAQNYEEVFQTNEFEQLSKSTILKVLKHRESIRNARVLDYYYKLEKRVTGCLKDDKNGYSIKWIIRKNFGTQTDALKELL